MIIDSRQIKTTLEFGSFMTHDQLEVLPQNEVDFEDYLKDKYDYISKVDMLRDEREARMHHKLDIRQAIEVWNKLYK